MRFGFCLPNNQGVDDPNQLVELAQVAERLGYDSVWVSEHLFHASYVAQRLGDRPYHEALAVLTGATLVTARVRLGTSVLVLPWHHPARLAKTAATLDALSHGRLVLGVGVGAAPDEYAALGVPYAERGALGDETLDAMRALWTQAVPAHEGRRYRFAGLPFAPKPRQKPHPPLWIGGNSAAALRRVARAGDGWHPLSLSPAQLAEGCAGLRRELQAADRAPELPVAPRLVLQFEGEASARPLDSRRGLRGTPDELVELARAHARAGATELVVDANTPDLGACRDAMARFAAEVAPALADA